MLNILVIGESCIDEYVYGTCSRVCPEAAALCFLDNGTIKSNKGMAHNVASNIKSIDKNITVSLVTNFNHIIKRRFVDTRYNTIVFRHDLNDYCDRIILDEIDFNNYDAIVVSDYCKGFLTETDISYIFSMAPTKCTKFIDTKKKIGNFINGADFIKINEKEYTENVNINHLYENTNLIVTLGDKGAKHYTKNTIVEYKVDPIEVRDVCGAGDTFLAGLVVKYLQSSNIADSIAYANHCAGLAVSRFGVVSI